MVGTFKEIKIPPVQLTLQFFRDAVGSFVMLFDPFSPFGVLDGHSRHTCAKERDIYTEATEQRGRLAATSPDLRL